MATNGQSQPVPETIERRLILGCVLIALLVVGLVLLAIRNIHDAGKASDWVNHTHAVILELDSIEASLHAAEGAHRSYLLTGDARDQDAYRQFFSSMSSSLAVTKVLMAGEAAQLKRLADLEPLLQARVDLARKAVEARGLRGVDGSREVLVASRARQDEILTIRRLIYEMKTAENDLLQERDHAQQASARAVRVTLVVGATLDALLLGFMFWLVRRDLGIRRHAAAALQAMNESLEEKVRERTAELAKSNEDLQLENMERQWAHAAMERRYRYAEMILGAVGEGIIVVGRGGSILDMNPMAIRMLGAAGQQYSGKPVSSILRLSAGETQDRLNDVLKKGKPVVDQSGTLVLADGSTKSVHWSCHPVVDDSKVVGGAIVVWPA